MIEFLVKELILISMPLQSSVPGAGSIPKERGEFVDLDGH
jgi:hypothetical protein